ncbi:MAG: glutamine--fructose-6-phosphate transaminase (isomerizing) [Candidatus Atribacteria bacterium]|nr:glutamine--fructose-6-phosphate transaminase (isomerizing) [Candidatus Atribacteria bacterium]
MCGIIGYVGEKVAMPVLLDGLKRLEYRGYDSAGIAVVEDGCMVTFRRTGKIAGLEALCQENPTLSRWGIGHTRWATHGVPSEKKAHPHLDCRQRIAVVHNGIIENYRQLRKELEDIGHVFLSETDSEVVAHLLEGGGAPLQRIQKTVIKLQGSYALCILFQEEPDTLYGVRMFNPLVLGVGENENFLASDIPAFLDKTRKVVFLDDGDITRITPNSWEIVDFYGKQKTQATVVQIPWDPLTAEKGGYKHFMLKEIHEQPQALEDTLLGRWDLVNGRVRFDELEGFALGTVERIVIIACGTACHAGMIGKYMIEQLARVPVEVDYASEFRYRDPLIDEKTLVLCISQSGETADTLAAARLARERQAMVLSICNGMGTTLTRISDRTLYTRAGVEIGVASTKAFSCQLAVLFLLSLYLAQQRTTIGNQLLSTHIQSLLALPRQMNDLLKNSATIHELARQYYLYHDFLYLGRGVCYPLALEGALKLKEVSYLHAEGLSAGEMKHGPIALIEPDVISVVLLGKGIAGAKTLGNIEEIKARKGKVIVVSHPDHWGEIPLVEQVITITDTNKYLVPLLMIIPLQLFAYYVALEKGSDVDQPRNLAKSVTVE